MSKKTVSFTMPSKQARRPAGGQQESPPTVEPNHVNALPAPSAANGVDKWVMLAEPIRVAAPRPIGVMAYSLEPTATNRIIIDLSTERSWFELVRLIYIFPYMAVCFWTLNAMGKWLGSYGSRR